MKKFGKAVVLSYLSFVANTIISIFISAFVVRKIGQTNYGVYQTMSSFLSYLVVLEFGTGSIMTRNISLCEKDGTQNHIVQKNISTIWGITLALSAVIVLASGVFYSFIDSIYSASLTSEQRILGKTVFVLAAAQLIFSFYSQTLFGIVLGYECYLFEKTISLLKLTVRTIILVVVLSFRQSIIFVVALDAAMSLIVLLVVLLFCIFKLKVKITPIGFDKEICRYIAPLAIAMMMQTIINSANGNVDKFLISILMTPEDVSVYAVSMGLYTMYSSVACLTLGLYMPKVAGIMKKGIDSRQLTDYIVQPCRLNVVITGAVCCGIALVGKEFIRLLYGDEYSSSWLYAIIIIIPTFFVMSNAVVINIVDVLRKRYIRSLILLGTTILNVVMTYFGILYYGMMGAAVATAISIITQFFALNIFYSKALKIHVMYLFRQMFKGTVPSMLVALALAYPLRILIKDDFVRFLVCGFAFVAIASALLILLGANETEKRQIKSFLKKLTLH